MTFPKKKQYFNREIIERCHANSRKFRHHFIVHHHNDRSFSLSLAEQTAPIPLRRCAWQPPRYKAPHIHTCVGCITPTPFGTLTRNNNNNLTQDIRTGCPLTHMHT